MAENSNKNASILLFLLGLGSLTQIYFFGCIALSEIVIFVVAPVMYWLKYCELRRLHFTLFTNMLSGVMISLFVSSWYNHTAYPFVIKTFASIYSVWSYFVVMSLLLRRNLMGLRWFLVGIFISSLITIFILNPEAQVSETGFSYVGVSDSRDVIESQLFWSDKLRQFAQIPIGGFYYQFPIVASILTPLAFIAVVAATTVSGRASSVAFIVTGVLILIGRKNRNAMSSIGKHFLVFLIIGIALLFAIKQAYIYAARNGLLGAEAQAKYERQFHNGTGVLSMLMAGRMGFFTAIPAALRRPIIGYGPYAEDTEGYGERFIMEYGDEDDIAEYIIAANKARAMGYRRQIPTHSYIMGAWVHYGLFGLMFYLWILYLLYQHIRKYAAAIPQWYGFFSMMIPYYLWHIFFSPFGFRWQFAILMTCIFVARAVGKGLILLPEKMEIEARKYDAR